VSCRTGGNPADELPEIAQPAIFAMQVALAELWWVQPAAIVGRQA